MASINYAAQYARELAQAYPYALNFGALYATENNGRYRMGEDGKSIYIPNISTTGRVDADRDSIANAARNYDNAWELKMLKNQRKWSTLVHPKDIDQTNEAVTIAKITQVFNEEQKFPEKDAYCVSELFRLWTEQGHNADHTELSASNVLSVFDEMMLKMDNARVPANGRILYCTNEVKTMLKQASGLTRNFDVQNGGNAISRAVSRIEEVSVIGVPATLMRTEYDFSAGWAVKDGADQINMFLVHPSAVITPESYQFAQLDPPSALTQGKYFYYEESFEDVFILNKKSDALQFHTTVQQSDDNTLTSLSVGSIELSPDFAKGTTSYTGTGSTGSVKVKAVATDGDAALEIKLGGTSKGTGTGSLEKNVTLTSGSNVITVEVTTNGQTKTYTATITAS